VDSNSVIISLEKACYTYQGENGAVEAIKDIDITITDGEFICLLGPS
jgi:ABC-type Fe3+/spermidine/putrescine transport system ATPase subunit